VRTDERGERGRERSGRGERGERREIEPAGLEGGGGYTRTSSTYTVVCMGADTHRHT
jgi:hypothetical protein